MGAPKLDPHLREVLEDLVENGPADGFFTKMQPERIGGVFRAPDEPVSIARAGFTSLERHLVRFHREELALILRQSFLASFYTVNPKPVCQLDLADPAKLASTSREAMQRATPGTFTYRSSHFLRRILRGEAITTPDDQISMLVASMRLEDHAHARHYYAMCMLSACDMAATRQSIAPLINSASLSIQAPALVLWREAVASQGKTEHADRYSTAALSRYRHIGNSHAACHEASCLTSRALVGTSALTPHEAWQHVEDRESSLLLLPNMIMEMHRLGQIDMHTRVKSLALVQSLPR